MEVFFAILSCLLIFCSASMLPAAGSPVRTERDLRRDLFRNYSRWSRREKYRGTKAELSMNVAFVIIREVNEKDHTIVLDSWIQMGWKDDFLTWDVNSYNNITALRVPLGDIWKPILLLDSPVYQYSRISTAMLLSTYAMIYPSGAVFWVPMFTLTRKCPMFNMNPKGNLDCNFELTFLNHDEIHLDTSLSVTEVDIENFKDINPDWILSGVKFIKDKEFYPCCEKALDVLYINVTIKRRPSIMNNSNENYSLS